MGAVVPIPSHGFGLWLLEDISQRADPSLDSPAACACSFIWEPGLCSPASRQTGGSWRAGGVHPGPWRPGSFTCAPTPLQQNCRRLTPLGESKALRRLLPPRCRLCGHRLGVQTPGDTLNLAARSVTPFVAHAAALRQRQPGARADLADLSGPGNAPRSKRKARVRESAAPRWRLSAREAASAGRLGDARAPCPRASAPVRPPAPPGPLAPPPPRPPCPRTPPALRGPPSPGSPGLTEQLPSPSTPPSPPLASAPASASPRTYF